MPVEQPDPPAMSARRNAGDLSGIDFRLFEQTANGSHRGVPYFFHALFRPAWLWMGGYDLAAAGDSNFISIEIEEGGFGCSGAIVKSK